MWALIAKALLAGVMIAAIAEEFLSGAGARDEARSLLTQAAELAPDNAEIVEHWAIAHKDA